VILGRVWISYRIYCTLLQLATFHRPLEDTPGPLCLLRSLLVVAWLRLPTKDVLLLLLLGFQIVSGLNCSNSLLINSLSSTQHSGHPTRNSYSPDRTQNQNYDTTDGQSASLSLCQAPRDVQDQIFVTSRELRVRICRPPSLKRGRVCPLQLLFLPPVTWSL
jgi:hypothetical protein